MPEREIRRLETKKLYPPEPDLHGCDRVGVLLCTRHHGELWYGFENTIEEARPFHTNATLFQVAAGAVSGWNLLGKRTGVHLIEELDWREFLDTAATILGPPMWFWDEHAPVRTLLERRIPPEGRRAPGRRVANGAPLSLSEP
jgi:homospermidine synthase